MLEILRNEKKETTTAIIEGCELDAAKRVGKRLDIKHDNGEICFCCIPHIESLLMKNKIVGTARPLGDDTYNEKEGRDRAVFKAMKNHKNAFTKALKRWQVAMIKDIRDVSPETFAEALKEVHTCKCEGFKH